MNYRALPTLVCEVWVAFVNQEEHHGARAEVERHALANKEPRVTVQLQLCQSPLLDIVHTNNGTGRRDAVYFSVGQQASSHYGRQAVDVANVVDLGAIRDRHGCRVALNLCLLSRAADEDSQVETTSRPCLH